MQDGYGFNFFVCPYKKRYDNNNIMNCFQIFEKFHELLFRDTLGMGCLQSIFLACCVEEGLTALDCCATSVVLNQGDFALQGAFGNIVVIFSCHSLCSH